MNRYLLALLVSSLLTGCAGTNGISVHGDKGAVGGSISRSIPF